MPTSARWEVANLPQISVKPVHSAGGQSRPPLQERAGDVVGADDSVGPKNITNSPRIPVKPVQSARADVGIGPYNQMRTYLRIRRRFPKIRCVLPGGAAPPLPELCVCKKNALSFHTQGEEDLRGTTCIPACAGTRSSVTGGPGGAYCVFSPAARRRRELRLCGSLHQPLPLCGAARSSFLFSACIGMGN